MVVLSGFANALRDYFCLEILVIVRLGLNYYKINLVAYAGDTLYLFESG